MSIETFTRWLYRGGRPNSRARTLNAVLAAGRKSSKPVRLPVVFTDLDGERHLVSMLSYNTNWVRNVRAADHEAVLIRVAAQPFAGRGFPSSSAHPSSSAAAKLQPAAGSTSPVNPEAPVSAFESVATRYPVLLIDPRFGGTHASHLP